MTKFDDRKWRRNLLNEELENSKLFSNSLVKKVASDIQKLFPKNKDTKVEYKEFRFANGDGGFTFHWDHGPKWFGSYHFSVSQNETTIHTTYQQKKFGQKTKGDRFTKGVKSYKDLNDDVLKGQFNSMKAVIKKNEKEAYKEFERDRDAQAAYYGSKSQTGRIGYGL
jgi:hypothetical protein